MNTPDVYVRSARSVRRLINYHRQIYLSAVTIIEASEKAVVIMNDYTEGLDGFASKRMTNALAELSSVCAECGFYADEFLEKSKDFPSKGIPTLSSSNGSLKAFTTAAQVYVDGMKEFHPLMSKIFSFRDALAVSLGEFGSLLPPSDSLDEVNAIIAGLTPRTRILQVSDSALMKFEPIRLSRRNRPVTNAPAVH